MPLMTLKNVAASVAVASLLTVSAAKGSSAVTPNAGAASVTHEDVERWAAAWNSHDIEMVLRLFDPNVVIHQPSNPKPLNLQEARGFFGMIFKAYPDFHIVVTDAVVEGNTAVSVERVTGTWSGPFVDPASGTTRPGNGRQFDHPGVMILKYGPKHKIRQVDIYWDRVVVNQQLGITS